MFKKILFLLILLFPFTSFSLDKNISVNQNQAKEVIVTNDDEIIGEVETKIYAFLYSTSTISTGEIITELELFTSKIENTRHKKIFAAVIFNIIKKENKATILEWWNVFDIDSYLFDKWVIKEWEYIGYVQNKDKIIALSAFFDFLDTQNTLEWYLYPDTYDIDIKNFKINEFVIMQLEAFEQKVYNRLFVDITNAPLYENTVIESVVNLASIVEKEEKNDSEKPIIAWILKKRVKEYWNLWADVTVCYPYKLTSNACKLVISKYINIETEYNTRFIIWLPPTPIWNPSFETVDATLNHEDTEYYYYLHDIKTGRVYYAETNEKHNENKALYLK